MRAKFSSWKERIQQYLSSEVLSFSQLMQILLPVLWEQAFLVVLSLLSIWMLSFDGENAVSVVNMMGVINKVFVSICLGLVTGGTVLVAQNIGAKRQRDASRSMVQAMGFAVLLSAALAVGLLLFRSQVIGYLLEGANPEIISGATLYFTGFCVSFPFYALYQSFAGGMRGWGKTKIAWQITLSVNCTELALTGFFVLVLKLGVVGITLAMLLSRIVGALIAACMMVVRRKELQLRILAYLKPDPAILRSILIIAVPLALEQFFFNSGKAMSQRFIASYGTAHMAANGVVNAIFDMINLPQITMREALVTVVGMCIGCGRHDLAKRYVYRFLRCIRVAIVALMPLTIPLSALLIWGYGLSAEANKMTVLCLGLIFTFGPLFLAGSFAIPAGLRAGGDAAYVSTVALCCMWIVRVTLSYVFAQVMGLGVVGVNLAMVVEWVFRNYIFRWRLKGTAWYSHQLIAKQVS